MYKEIVKLVIMMISQPTKTWKMLQESIYRNSDGSSFLQCLHTSGI